MKSISFKSLLIISFILSVLFLVPSCKKANKNEEAITLTKQLDISDFFKTNNSTNPEVTKVAENLLKQSGFKEQLNAFVQKNGFPVWEKAFVNVRSITELNQQNLALSNESEGSSSSGLIFIPFKDENTNEIKAYAECIKHDDSVYSYRLYNKNELSNFNIGANDTLKQARKISLSFIAYFEKLINGNQSTYFGGTANYSLNNVNISVASSNQDNSYQTDDNNIGRCGYWTYLEQVHGYSDGSGGTIIEVVRIPYFVFCSSLLTGTGSTTTSWSPSNVGTPGHLASGMPGSSGVNSGVTFYSGTATGSGLPTYGWWNYGTGYNGIYLIGSWYDAPNNYYPGWSGPSAYWYADPNEVLVQQITHALNLNYEQQFWLLSNPTDANAIKELLDQEEYNQDLEIAVKIAIDVARQGGFTSPVNSTLHHSIASTHLTSCCPINLIMPSQYNSHILARMGILRAEGNCNYLITCYAMAVKELLQTGLDIIGLIPGIGEFADITNGVIYTVSGDFSNAVLSAGQAIPIAGWGFFGTKWARKVVKLTPTSKGIKLEWFRTVDNAGRTIINFGKRDDSKFRRILGIVTGDGKQAHHIIPWETQLNDVVQQAAQAKFPFHMQDILNGVGLSAAQHMGSHPAYTTRVTAALQKIKDDLGANFSPQTAYEGIVELTNRIKAAIAANPNTPINQLIF